MSKWGRMLIAMLLAALLCLSAAAGFAQGVLTLPESLKTIEAEAFSGAKGFSEIVLPEGVEAIGSRAFADSAIERINLPKSVASIADDAFAGSDVLATVTQDSYAHAFCEGEGVRFDLIPSDSGVYAYTAADDGVTIDRYNGNQTVIGLPDAIAGSPVVAIGENAFSGCAATSIKLPKSLLTVADLSFMGCESLERVVVRSSETQFEGFAFLRSNSNLVLVGDVGSAAEAYARAYGIGFEDRATGAILFDSDYGYTIADGTAAINAYTGTETAVELPSDIEGMPVTRIGHGALLRNGDVTGVTVPDGVATIGSQAFAFCSALEYAEIPASVTEIGSRAFQGVAEGFVIYGYTGSAAETYASENGHAFVAVDAEATPDEATPDEATPSEPEIEATPASSFTYTIANDAVTIDQFIGYETDVVVPRYIEGYPVVRIEDSAFFYCDALKTVMLQSGITEIGGSAFQYCESLQSVSLSEGVKVIGERAFMGCTALERIELPAGVETIGYWAFNECTALKEVILNEGLISIASEAFCDCEKLTEVVIPEGTQQLGEGAFYGCVMLEKLTIPASVTRISGCLISTDTRLRDMQICGVRGTAAEVYAQQYALCFVLADGTVCFDYDYGFTVSNGEATITVFDGLDTEISVPTELEGYPVTKIADYAFADQQITSLTVGQGVKNIGTDAFRGCEVLTSIQLPATLERIEAGAFAKCVSLREVVLPEGLRELGSLYQRYDQSNGVFQGCTSLQSITLPQSLTVLGPAAFADCQSLVSVKIPDQVSTLYGRTFLGCSALERIYVPETVDAFSSYWGGFWLQAEVFEGCTATIYTEYGAPVIDYAQKYGTEYFYLSLTDEVLPSKEHWIGDDYAYGGMIRCSDPLSYVQVKVTDAQTGAVVLSANAEGMDTDTYRFAPMAKSVVYFEDLDLGSYVYTLYAIAQTERGEEAEVLCEYAFEVVPAPFRYKLQDGYQLPSSIHIYGDAYTATGTLRTNYDMESVQVTVEHVKKGTVYSGPVLTPNERTADMAALHEGIDFSTLEAGTYEYEILVYCNGQKRRVSPYSFVVARYDGAMDEERARALLDYCAIAENRNVFDYSDYRDILDNISVLDQLGMALSSRTEIFYEEIKAKLKDQDQGYVTQLYKKEILNLLDRMDKDTDLISSNAELQISKILYSGVSSHTSWEIQEFKYDVKEAKASYRTALEKKYGEKLTGDALEEVVDLQYKYADDCLDHVSKFVEMLGMGMEATEYSLDFIEVICTGLNDYQNMMMILDSLMEGYGDVPDAFAVALEEVRAEYQSGFYAALYKVKDKIITELAKTGVKQLTAWLFEGAGATGAATYKLVDFVITLGLELSGTAELSDNYFTFVTRMELALQSEEAYCSLFDQVAGGDASYDTLTQLEMMFEAAKSAYDGLYDTMINKFNDYPEIYIWMGSQDEIAKLKMP